ncbi:hypothetical protein WJX81_004392 [Elliptochloris bilobata]|uniref:F-box domain-containing protein n=1 Tax=Elliptochloris bilobata TaxID=381761 RepID=A0AAW1RR14_9CHLO
MEKDVALHTVRQAPLCPEAPNENWATLPVDVIGRVIGHMQHATLEALSEVNAHWRSAVKVHVRRVLLDSFADVGSLGSTFPALAALEVEDASFDAADLAHVAALRRLRSLKLLGCTARKGASGALTALRGLTGLRELAVHGLGSCEPGALDATLCGLTGLRVLSLAAPTPASAAPALATLSALSGLRTLHVSAGTDVALPGLAAASQLGRLQELDLQGAGTTDAFLADLADAALRLTRLRLCGEEAVTDAGLRAVGRLRTLRRLEFSAPIRRSLTHEALSVAGLAALGGLTGLSELNLSGNACFTSVGMDFVAHLTGLRLLNLTWVLAVSPLTFLAPLKSLTALSLAFTFASDVNLRIVLGCLRSLRTLDLAFTRIGRGGARVVAKLEHLRVLNLRSCTKLCTDDIVDIAGACTRLQFINLDGCQVPGSCVVRVFAARQGIRFCHQLACLTDEATESPMWRDAQVRFVFRCINLVCTFLMTSPYRYNILSHNRARLRYARTRVELACELVLFFFLAAGGAALAALGAARLIWLSFSAGPRLALRFLAHPLGVVHEACDFVHLCWLYWRLASGYIDQ